MGKSRPAYYAVIPANIRYDANLTANAKLLYGEISALCNAQGVCWASNDYFAELYDVKADRISRLISSLEKCGYIKREIVRNKSTNEVEKRLIWIIVSAEIDEQLSLTPPGKNTDTYLQKSLYPPGKNDVIYNRKNNTRVNKANIPKKEKYGEFQNVLLTADEYKKLCARYGAERALNAIEEISAHCESVGKKFANHYAALLNWIKRSYTKAAPPPPRRLKTGDIDEC